MAEEIGLDAVLRPKLDQGAARRESSKLSQVLNKAASLTPDIGRGGIPGMGGVMGRIPGAGSLTSMLGGGRASSRRNTARAFEQGSEGLENRLTLIAKLNKDQLDELEKLTLTSALDAAGSGANAVGGGAGAGVLGRVVGLLGGGVGAGALAVGGSAGVGALLQDQFGAFSLKDLFDFQTSPEGMIANALTGGMAGAAAGIGNLALGVSGDIGEQLGLVEDADAFEARMKEVVGSLGGRFRIALERAADEFAPSQSLSEMLQVGSLPSLTSAFGVASFPTLSSMLDLSSLPSVESLLFGGGESMQRRNPATGEMMNVGRGGGGPNFGDRVGDAVGSAVEDAVAEWLGDLGFENLNVSIPTDIQFNLNGLDDLKDDVLRDVGGDIDSAIDEFERRLTGGAGR